MAADEEKDEKLRLGGMALANGVLVHGPTTWAAAVRTADGEVKVVAERKRVTGSGVTKPMLRGPARLVESVAVLPRLKRTLPEAKLPFEGRAALASMVGTAVAISAVRRAKLSTTSEELVAGILSVAPAILALRRGSLAAYHGAEHIAIGTYERDAVATREHERCGGHLVGPMLATATFANLLATKAPQNYRPAARLAASVGALAASTEIFGWMQRNPERRLARFLSFPGHELQHRFSTAEPSADQLEVAEAALNACLELENE
jgi:uncharacterized protein YqhQ